jgi:hypothetical protein
MQDLVFMLALYVSLAYLFFFFWRLDSFQNLGYQVTYQYSFHQ